MDKRDRHTTLCFMACEAFWGTFLGLTMPSVVLTVLLLENGASKTMIGMVSAAERGFVYLLPLLGLWLFHSRRKRQGQLIAWHLFAVIPFICVQAVLAAYSEALPPYWYCWLMTACLCGFYLAIGVIVAPWQDWMAHVIPKPVRGRIVGLAFSCNALFAGFGLWLAGTLMSRAAPVPVYEWLYAAGAVLTVLAILATACIRDTGKSEAEDARFSLADAVKSCGRSLADRNHAVYLGARLLSVAALAVVPFFTVYYTSKAGGGLEGGTVVKCAAAMAAGAALASVATGRFGDRYGHRSGNIFGAAALTLSLLAPLSSRGLWSCLAAFTLIGMAGYGFLVAHMNFMYENCPHHNRLAHLTISNMILGLGGIAAAICAGRMVEEWGPRPFFWTALGFGMASLCTLVLLVREPRRLAGPPLGPTA